MGTVFLLGLYEQSELQAQYKREQSEGLILKACSTPNFFTKRFLTIYIKKKTRYTRKKTSRSSSFSENTQKNRAPSHIV